MITEASQKFGKIYISTRDFYESYEATLKSEVRFKSFIPPSPPPFPPPLISWNMCNMLTPLTSSPPPPYSLPPSCICASSSIFDRFIQSIL